MNYVTIKVKGELTNSKIRCLGKKSYPTKKSVLSACARVYKDCQRKVTYYKCPCCREFHLTSQAQNER